MTDHKLISTPVSVADGMKRGDSKTWRVLLVTGFVAVVVVLLFNVFVEKGPPVKWPTVTAPVSSGQAPPSAPAEPRSYDVAPPGSAAKPPGAK